MRKLFVLLWALLALAGCDGWVIDPGPSANDMEDYTFRYYYVQDCYDDLGSYNCSSVDALSHSISISIRIDYDGDATLIFDGDTYRFWSGDYVSDYDRWYGHYYQFELGLDVLTVYMDGSEAIFEDYSRATNYHYYYRMP